MEPELRAIVYIGAHRSQALDSISLEIISLSYAAEPQRLVGGIEVQLSGMGHHDELVK